MLNIVKHPIELAQSIIQASQNKSRAGEYCGFKSLDKIFTAKKGFPLFVAGAPHSGKSQFVKQLIVNWALSHGWRGLVYMGEEGSAADVVLDLIEVKTGRPARSLDKYGKPIFNALKEHELHREIQWATNHFLIVDPEEASKGSWTFFDWAELLNLQTGLDWSVLDPFNDLDRGTNIERDDIWLTDILKAARIGARQSNRIDVIVNHIAKTSHDGKTTSGMPISKPARPSEWAGGQTWFRRAFTMLLVYRPPAGEIIDFSPFAGGEDGYKVGNGETWIQNQKAKPKGSGELGWARLYYDKERNQYFECDEENAENGRFTLDGEGKLKKYFANELK
jgi:hypothetical protein